MKKILLSLVLSTVFAAASNSQEGATTTETNASSSTLAATLNASDNVEQQPATPDSAASNENENLRKPPSVSFEGFLEDAGEFSPLAPVLAAACRGFKEYVLPNVLTPQFAFGLGTGLTTAYFSPASCK